MAYIRYGVDLLLARQIQFDCFGRFFLLCINDLSINLSGAHISMTKHFADSINVSTSGELQGRIRMPEAVEQNPQSSRQQAGNNKT